ncbi:MAG: hypothetical protein IRZ16_20760 [Myxococcaceae bacterium]|nr:hypothetical protein [Myxococcaceae bacterium]
MYALVLAAALAAAPAPATRAQSLAKSGAWEELYLAFSAADPGAYDASDRRTIARDLLLGARALESSDAVLAFSLAERAVAFDQTEAGLLLLARTAEKTQQGGAAEQALTRGLERFPHNGTFALELGRKLLSENDPVGAIRALERVPPKSKQAAEAKALLLKARAAAAEQEEATRTARAIERRLNVGGPAPKPRPATATAAGEGQYDGIGYTSGVGPGGMRTRGNRHFVFRYFNDQRDFGQRADYEGNVVDALEDARAFTRKVLGRAREAPVDVILYTREEFAMHHGRGMSHAVAGFYSDNAIRMNDAAEINPQTRATLVHEYVHAAVDEFAGGSAERLPRWVNEGLAEYVEWRYQGSENPPLWLSAALQSEAKRGTLPTLQSMSHRALIEQSDPSIAYGTSAIAVKLLLGRGGVENLLGLIRDVGSGQPFEQVLQIRYERTLDRLNEEVASELKGR